jgi:hypothetical protein
MKFKEPEVGVTIMNLTRTNVPEEDRFGNATRLRTLRGVGGSLFSTRSERSLDMESKNPTIGLFLGSISFELLHRTLTAMLILVVNIILVKLYMAEHKYIIIPSYVSAFFSLQDWSL